MLFLSKTEVLHQSQQIHSCHLVSNKIHATMLFLSEREVLHQISADSVAPLWAAVVGSDQTEWRRERLAVVEPGPDRPWSAVVAPAESGSFWG